MDEACGGAAVRIDPGDADAMAAGIREAIARRDELAAAGLEHARRFTWRRCGEIHLRAFEQAAA
jgi:glycosyltransferase involved in cell wall biosynthesis